MEPDIPANTPQPVVTPMDPIKPPSPVSEFIRMNQRTLMLAGILLATILITGASFYLGYQKQMSQATPEITPTPTPEPTDETTVTSEDTPTEAPSPTDIATPTPTKKPTPTRTPTQTPIPTPSFTVSSIRATVDSPTFNFTDTEEPCKHTFRFYGYITTNGTGDATYRWERTDGNTDTQTMHFTGAGEQQTPQLGWDLPFTEEATTSGKTYHGSMQFHLLTPVDKTSDTINVTLTCPTV